MRAVTRGVAALLVALALLAVVPATELGTRWLAGLIDWWAGDRLNIGEVSGRLVRTVRFRQLEARHQSLDLTAALVTLSWRPASLLDGEVHVTALEMNGVTLELHQLPAAPDEAPPIGLAFELAAPSVTIKNLTVVRDGEEIPIEAVEFSTHLSAAQMTVTDLAAAGATWRLTANAAVVPHEPFDLDLQAWWKNHVDGAGQEGRLTITGNSRALDFEATLQTPIGVRSSGQVKLTPEGYVVAATGTWRDLRWPPFTPPSVRSPQGRFELGGALDKLSVALDFELAADGLPSTRMTLSGAGSFEPSAAFPFDLTARWQVVMPPEAALSGELDVSGDRENVVVRPRILAPFAASAEVALVLVGEPRFDAVAKWSGLFWPLAGRRVIASPEGTLEAKGSASLMDVTLTAALEAPERVRDGRVSATARLAMADEPEVTGSFDWNAEIVPLGATLRGAGTLNGNLSGVLQFTHELSAPFALSTVGEGRMGGPAPQFDMMSEWVDLRWPPERPDALSSPRGSLEVHGSLEDFHAVLAARLDPEGGVDRLHMEARGGTTAQNYHVDVQWRANLADGHPLAGQGRIEGGSDQARLTHVLTVPFELTTEGVVDSPVAAPELRLTGEWRDLHWPPTQAARYRSATGAYTLNGPLDALEIQLDGALDADAMPPARVTLTGRLDSTGLDLEPLRIHTLGGQVTARGRVGWHPGIDWKLAVDARGLDPGRRWPQWKGTLDGVAILQGGVVDGVARTAADIQHLEGQLRDYPVEGHGKVEIAGKRLRAHSVSLRSGDNRLKLDGVYDRVMDFQFSLEAADLSAVFPDAHGRLTGEGIVGGGISSPRVTMRLTGQDMRYRDWGARLLEVDADVSGGRTTSRAVVKVADARAGDHRIGSLELRADGSPAAHTAHATLESSLGDVDLKLAGGVETGHWRGELADLTLAVPDGGTWHLARVAQLSVGADRIQVGTTCLESDTGASACADFERTDHARSSIEIQALPLSVLQPWLPAHSTLTGKLDAKGVWSLSSGRLDGNLVASVSPGKLTVLRDQSERIEVAHADTELKITVDGSGAGVRFRSVLGGDGRVQGEVVVAGLHEEAALDGTIEVSLPRLAPIAAFVAGPFTAEGQAFMEARIGGSVTAPRARGVARIEVTHARIHDLGIELSDSWLEARADDEQRVAVNGVLRSGAGHLSIDGSGLLEAGGWTPTEFIVTGESFEIMRLPEAVITVSPDVTVNAVGESLDVNGRVVIPRARITPPEITEGAVSVSSDEVLVDRTGKVSQPEAGRGPEVTADLAVALGDDVVFDGFGLTSRLAGDLRIRHSPGVAPAAFGALDLVDGQFVVYGQRLNIEHGRVTFSGPLNDPGLDIRAVRKAGDVTAGIVIGGTVSNPGSRVYSKPPLGETEAFSLLLTGHTLSGSNQREAALLSQAALSLGLKGSERIGMKIQSALGLDDLSVGGNGDAGDASLILGKRLSPDLGVRYVHSLVRHAGSVFFNYRLTDHFSIEAESGVRQGLDVLFSVERDDVKR